MDTNADRPSATSNDKVGKSTNGEDLSSRPYIKYSPDIEKIPDDEEEDIQAVADQINVIQRAMFNLHRHCYSGMA